MSEQSDLTQIGQPDAAEANLTRLALRDLETTMERLIDADGRALSLAARAGQAFLDGNIPADRQDDLLAAMEQVVNISLEARKAIRNASRMTALGKAAERRQSADTTDESDETLGIRQKKAIQRQRRLNKMRL